MSDKADTKFDYESMTGPEDDGKFTDWYGFDTENDPTGKVTMTALVHESGAKEIWTRAGRLGEWIDDLPATCRPIIICHNLEYDLINEFGDNYAEVICPNYLKGRLISARYGRAKFIDSFNHFRMSLKKIGDSIGIKKLGFDITNPEYVATDSWICLKAMTMARDYIRSLGGELGATSGSSAVSVWRHMTDDEFVYGTVDTPWLRKGYYGGRTEIFHSYAAGDIRGYDINSMYPFCMMDEYPEYLMPDPHWQKAKGMVEAVVAVPIDLFVAPLPGRTKDNLLRYPVGRFQGVWTYDELRWAESLGTKVIKIIKAQGCNALVKPFDDFILTLYAKRKATSSESEKLFLKVVMNSLYGKIASKSQITRIVSRHTLLKSRSNRMEEVKWVTPNRGLLEYQCKPPPYVNVCWGSMVTANSRILLGKYLCKVPREKLIYCDTDSLYANGYELPESAELGGMKLEKRAKVMEIKQPKCYRLDDEYKAKGVPRPKYNEKGNIEIDFAQQYFEDGYTEFQAPIRWRQSLTSRRGKANQWVTAKKARRSSYTAKTFHNGRYTPPVLGEQGDLFEKPPESTKPIRSKLAATK